MTNPIPKCLLTDQIRQRARKHTTTYFQYVAQLSTFLEKVRRDIPAIHVLFPQFTPHDNLHHLEPLFKLASDLLGEKLLKRLNITELDLHYSVLTLTLTNLSIIDIDEGRFKDAVEKIEVTLLLALSRQELGVDYLRLRLPENHLGFRVKWEQHPANVIEASYINLAYAVLKLEGSKKACNVIDEGLELMPSAGRLKHAMARVHLFDKRADLAYPVYGELAGMEKLPDEGILPEIRRLGRRVRPKAEKKIGRRN